jgi:hypothetical protein
MTEAEAGGSRRGLDALAAENAIVNNLLQIMRSSTHPSLDEAIAQMARMPFIGPPELLQLEEAAGLIRREQRLLMLAREPAAVTADGYESWYAGAQKTDPNWGAMRNALLGQGWDEAALDDLNKASDRIVAYLPDPRAPRDGKTKAVGLVLGYVQSGKTTNFTAVINKAADAGYKCFIVLSGLHNGLREQTQVRLVEQVSALNKGGWRLLTEPEADFVATPNVDADLSATEQPVLIVVKKQINRLRALRKWLDGAAETTLNACPVLVIDDEADQASVNTAAARNSRSAINRVIREILSILPRSAFVGYTATPFANVFIDPAEYDDLYPRDFIVDLPRPANYLGPEAIFGREPLEFDPDGASADGHDLIRSIGRHEAVALRKKGASVDLEADAPAMQDALRYFILSTAARRVRGHGNRHSTALVHTSQYVASHFAMAGAIGSLITEWRSDVAASDSELLLSMAAQWESECQRVSAEDFDNESIGFDELRPYLPAVLADVRVVIDNSMSADRLDYGAGGPQTVIAVGGNTLSRGLTLEGLSVSYFIRTASAYDTALQMGRWFGYRVGYADLTRIWMTDEMRGWFHHLATVEAEIRADISRYETDHVTPEQLAVGVRTHPQMAITAASKMGSAIDASVSYSGRRLQTIHFAHEDADWLGSNLRAGRELIARARKEGYAVIRPSIKAEGSWLIGPVPSEMVIDFLRTYKFHEVSRDLNSELIERYIRDRLADDELRHFRIAVMGRQPLPELGTVDLGLDELVGMINRAPLAHIDTHDYVDIKALTSKSDRVIDLLPLKDADLRDLSEGDIANLRNVPPKGQGDDTGLLLLYPISRSSRKQTDSKTRKDLNAADDMLGVGLVFPSTENVVPIGYKTADLSGVVRQEPDGIPEEGAEDV